MHSDNFIDQYVGKRLRLRRNIVGWSQEQLGKALGVTFQQVQKYERGANRIGASRLYTIAQLLNTNVSFFFDEIASEHIHNLAEPKAIFEYEKIIEKEIILSTNL